MTLPLSQIDVEHLIRFGLHAHARSDRALALAVATMLTDSAPTKPEASRFSAATFARAGRAAEAAAAYQRAVAAAPDDVESWVGLAEAQLMRLAYPEACAALDEAITLDPNAETPAGVRAQMLVVDILSQQEG